MQRKEIGSVGHRSARAKPAKAGDFIFQGRHGGMPGRTGLAELFEHPAGRVGHHRPEADGNFSHGCQQYVHHCSQPFHVALLVQRPGSLAVYILVQTAHKFPETLQSLRELDVAEKLRVIAYGSGAEFNDRFILGFTLLRLGNLALEIFGGHGKHAAEKIAQIIGQISINPSNERFLAEICVRAEMHLAQEKIAERVRPETTAQIRRIPRHCPEILTSWQRGKANSRARSNDGTAATPRP